MQPLRIAVCAAAALFSLLCLTAAGSQAVKAPKPSHIVMALGSILLLAAVLVNVLGSSLDWLAALLAGGLLCGAAIQNGRRAGSLHLSHHIVRILLCALLVIGFIFV